MLAVSVLRELLGQGSILNYQIFVEPPLSLAANPPGAFLILSLVAFIY
jgi:Na+-transporting NADH:ubiquinone oxidoreductase subunit NqrD